MTVCIETTDGGSELEIRTIHELLSCLSPNTTFIAIEEEEKIFWLCQKGNGDHRIKKADKKVRMYSVLFNKAIKA